jgi:hypothetical protein
LITLTYFHLELLLRKNQNNPIAGKVASKSHMRHIKRWTKRKMKIDEGQIHWFIHELDKTPTGLIRMRNGGALIIGGKTGTHLTGHGESYWAKIKELISHGYVPVEIAMELQLVPADWQQPEIQSKTDREWVEKAKRREL